MRMLCNRFNPEWVIKKMKEISSQAPLGARWQVSFQDKCGRYHDHYFVAKPTRKQISHIKKG